MRHNLFVSREESRELLRYEWNPDKKAPTVLEKRFEVDPGGPLNKGIEGLAFISGDVSPTGQPQPQPLLAEHGKGKQLPIKLAREVLALCRDFSAVTIDPKTGHLFLASDESAAVAQIKLVRDGDKVIGKLHQLKQK